jgi:23S rRNA (guanosine2251-2'-O)-methyltransferase
VAKTELIVGRNPVREVLRAGRREIHQVMVARGSAEHGVLGEILVAARQAGVPVKRVPRAELGSMADHHHGVLAVTGPYPYVELADVMELAAIRGEDPFILMLDALQDPQNLGTLLRTAEAVGAHGVILPYRGGVGVTPAVVAASAGASEHMRIVGANLAQTMADLKADGVWIVGLDPGGDVAPLDRARLRGPLALVVGNEGRGMRRLVRQSCDFLMRLPSRGALDSMNAAVAGSIVLYEAYQARLGQDQTGARAGSTPGEDRRRN